MRVLVGLAAGLVFGCTSQPTLDPVPVAQFERTSADQVQHGKRLAVVLGCAGCHGEKLTGIDWSEPGFGSLWTANLTRAIGDYNDQQLAQIIQSGKRPDRELWEMPSHLFTQLTPDDMAAVIAYLRSVPPTGISHPPPMFEEGARKEIAAGTFKSSAETVREQGDSWPPDAGPGHELGRYIVRSTCAECHKMDLRGGTPFPGAEPRPDLRMVEAYDIDQFRHLMKTGKAVGDREVSLMSTVARGRYSQFTDQEISAVHSYLQDVASNSP